MPTPSSLKSLDHFAQDIGTIGENAQLAALARPTPVSRRNGNRCLVHIQMA